MHAQLLQSCPTLFDPMHYSPPDSSVYGILQARILWQVAMPSSRGFSQPKDGPLISWVLCIAGLVAQMGKNLPAMQETWVRSLGWEDPLEEGIATHSSILVWRIPWTEEPGGLQSMGSQKSQMQVSD